MSDPRIHDAASPALAPLLMALSEGALSPEQVRELRELLKGSAAARQAYTRYMTTHAMLARQLASPLSLGQEPAGAVPVSAAAAARLRTVRLRRVVRFAAAAVIVAMVGLCAAVLVQTARQQRQLAGVRMPVATLIEASDAVWGAAPGEATPQVGGQLPVGTLRLVSGRAEIEFFSGAKVAMQGPCELGLNSVKRGFLGRGRITAVVPHEAKGFTIAAPGMAVIDLGTSFAMDVDPRGASRVEVLEGHVEVRAGGEPGRILHAGSAVARSVEGELREVTPALIDTNRAAFYLPFEGTLGAAARNLEVRGLNPKLMARGIGLDGPAPVYDLDVPGPVVTDGVGGAVVNAANRSSLRFRNTGLPTSVSSRDGGAVSIDDPGGADSPLKPRRFTVEAFVKLDNTLNFPTLIGKARGNGGASWTLDAGGNGANPAEPIAASILRARLDTQPPGQAEGPGFNQGIVSTATLSDHAWHHIAATYDSGTREMVLYVDYKAVARGTAVNAMVYDDGPLWIGNLAGGRAFDGWIDEVRLTPALLGPEAFLHVASAGGVASDRDSNPQKSKERQDEN